MEWLLLIAMAWLGLALGCCLVLWFQTGRRISELDRRCTWTDHALRRQYGARTPWAR